MNGLSASGAKNGCDTIVGESTRVVPTTISLVVTHVAKEDVFATGFPVWQQSSTFAEVGFVRFSLTRIHVDGGQ